MHNSNGKKMEKTPDIHRLIMRIYHEFVDRIDNSVLRVTAWHHEALTSDAKQ